jgi:hypothetical protein
LTEPSGLDLTLTTHLLTMAIRMCGRVSMRKMPFPGK